MRYYQYIIYDNQREDCYNEDGVITEISNLYTGEDMCKEQAIETVEELHKDFDCEDRFEYLITEVRVID